MRHRFPLGFAVLACAIAQPVAAHAQQSLSPKVTVAHKGADKLLDDMKAFLGLTNPQQQKQWKVLKGYIEVFLPGVDRTKPVRLDIVTGGHGTVGFQPSIPVSNMKVFRKKNLKPAGIDTVRQARTRYKCKGNVFQGFLRHKHRYAIFAPKLSAVPLSIADPRTAIKGLMAAYDLGMVGRNLATDSASIAARRAWVQKQAKELLAAVKKKDGETKADYELRKLMLRTQMKEAERFYAESSLLRVGWKMDMQAMTGGADLELVAIPGTPLAKSIQLLGVKPSYFANIPRHPNTILSLRLNHPLDEMRKTAFLDVFKALRDKQVADIKTNRKMTAAQKDAGNKAADMIIGLLAANLDKGICDLFVETHSNSTEKNTVLAAFRTVDGKVVFDILKELAKTGIVSSIKYDVAKESDVRIHSVVIDLGEKSALSFFLGSDELLIGTSKDAIWFASGVKALAELKAGIKLAKAPVVAKKDAPFLDLLLRFAPLVALENKAIGKKGDTDLRKLALGAFNTGQDGLSVRLTRKGDNVIGRMDVETDCLRFVGALIAQFSRDTLDDANQNKKKPKRKLP